MTANEFLKSKNISDNDFMDSGVTEFIEQLLTEYAESKQLIQSCVVWRSEQLCGYHKCKNITADKDKLFCHTHLKQINS